MVVIQVLVVWTQRCICTHMYSLCMHLCAENVTCINNKMEARRFIQWELGKIQHFLAKVPDLTMALNNYSAQNITKGCNIIIAESNRDARDKTGTTLKSKNVFHCPMDSVCMWKSRSLLSEQTSAWWKVCRVPADCRHRLLSYLWWSSCSADHPFSQRWVYHDWLTCMISMSSSTKPVYNF